jgi:hypothetical protein
MKVNGITVAMFYTAGRPPAVTEMDALFKANGVS